MIYDEPEPPTVERKLSIIGILKYQDLIKHDVMDLELVNFLIFLKVFKSDNRILWYLRVFKSLPSRQITKYKHI